MGRKTYRKLEARLQDLEDKVVVYALTSRRPPQDLVLEFVAARSAAEAARGKAGQSERRHGLLGRLLHPAAGG